MSAIITAQTIAARLRADLGVTNPNSMVAGGAWAKLDRYVGYGDMGWPYGVTVAMLGIDHAVNTGRLDVSIVTQIKALSDWEMVGLIADIAEACDVPGKVTHYLINRYLVPA